MFAFGSAPNKNLECPAKLLLSDPGSARSAGLNSFMWMNPELQETSSLGIQSRGKKKIHSEVDMFLLNVICHVTEITQP